MLWCCICICIGCTVRVELHIKVFIGVTVPRHSVVLLSISSWLFFSIHVFVRGLFCFRKINYNCSNDSLLCSLKRHTLSLSSATGMCRQRSNNRGDKIVSLKAGHEEDGQSLLENMKCVCVCDSYYAIKVYEFIAQSCCHRTNCLQKCYKRCRNCSLTK